MKEFFRKWHIKMDRRAYDLSNEGDTFTGRFLTNTAHFLPFFMCLWIPFLILEKFDNTGWGLIYTVFSYGSGLSLVFVFLVTLSHQSNTRLCVRCMSEMPENPSAKVQQFRWALRALHWQDTKRGSLIFLFVTTVRVALVTFGVPKYLFLPIDLYFVVWLYTFWLHHRLRAWCPYCPKWGEGNDGAHEPSPDPVVHEKI